jgi:hypothetical protein
MVQAFPGCSQIVNTVSWSKDTLKEERVYVLPAAGMSGSVLSGPPRDQLCMQSAACEM